MSGCLALGGAAASGQWAQEGTPRAAVDSGRRRRAAQGERQRLKPAALSRAVGRRLPARLSCRSGLEAVLRGCLRGRRGPVAATEPSRLCFLFLAS